MGPPRPKGDWEEVVEGEGKGKKEKMAKLEEPTNVVMENMREKASCVALHFWATKSDEGITSKRLWAGVSVRPWCGLETGPRHSVPWAGLNLRRKCQVQTFPNNQYLSQW